MRRVRCLASDGDHGISVNGANRKFIAASASSRVGVVGTVVFMASKQPTA
jgi:hypothetical protein